MEKNSFKEYSVLATKKSSDWWKLDRIIAWLNKVAKVAHNNTSQRLGKKITELLPQS